MLFIKGVKTEEVTEKCSKKLCKIKICNNFKVLQSALNALVKKVPSQAFSRELGKNSQKFFDGTPTE